MDKSYLGSYMTSSELPEALYQNHIVTVDDNRAVPIHPIMRKNQHMHISLSERPIPYETQQKTHIPIDEKISLLYFDEVNSRQSMYIHEQREWTGLTVYSLRRYVLFGKDIVHLEGLDREAVEWEEDLAMKCIIQDVMASYNKCLVKTLECLRLKGEKLFKAAMEFPSVIEAEERYSFDNILQWERVNRPYMPVNPKGVPQPKKWPTIMDCNHMNFITQKSITKMAEISHELVPYDTNSQKVMTSLINTGALLPGLNPQEEQGKFLSVNGKQRISELINITRQRNEIYNEETLVRIDVYGDESAEFNMIEEEKVHMSFPITHPKVPTYIHKGNGSYN